MTRRDYIRLALALSNVRENVNEMEASKAEHEARYDTWASTCSNIATALEADNERFDRQRFLYACATGEVK